MWTVKVNTVKRNKTMTKLEKKADDKAREMIAAIRGCTKSVEIGYKLNPAMQMMRDLNAGGIETLMQLFPNLPAWTETKWIH